MKCKRCNSEIKKGELFCSNCGASIEEDKEKENTHVIKLDGLKDDDVKIDNDKDPFFQPGLEQKNSSGKGFLIFIIIVLFMGIGYLLYDNNYFNLKKKKTSVPTSNEVVLKSISYNNLLIDVKDNDNVSYKAEKIYLNNNSFDAVIYECEDDFDDIIKNIDEITLKEEEIGITLDSHKTLSDNTYIYEMIGNYKNNKHIIYLLKISNKTLVFEFSINTGTNYDDVYKDILAIVKSTKLNNKGINDNFAYPELNLNPIGSQ